MLERARDPEHLAHPRRVGPEFPFQGFEREAQRLEHLVATKGRAAEQLLEEAQGGAPRESGKERQVSGKKNRVGF